MMINKVILVSEQAPIVTCNTQRVFFLKMRVSTLCINWETCAFEMASLCSFDFGAIESFGMFFEEFMNDIAKPDCA